MCSYGMIRKSGTGTATQMKKEISFMDGRLVLFLPHLRVQLYLLFLT